MSIQLDNGINCLNDNNETPTTTNPAVQEIGRKQLLVALLLVAINWGVALKQGLLTIFYHFLTNQFELYKCVKKVILSRF